MGREPRNERIMSDRSKSTETVPETGIDDLFCWVWECVLTDNTAGMALAYAPDEAGAWEALKEADCTAWWSIRGCYEDRDDPRTPEELPSDLRPRKVTAPEGFACWGGGYFQSRTFLVWHPLGLLAPACYAQQAYANLFVKIIRDSI